MNTETIEDYIVLGVPEDVEVDDKLRNEMTHRAEQYIAAQYTRHRRPKAIIVEPIEWLITSSADEVEQHQPAHDCAACHAGNDRARAFLAEFPGRRLALANLRYTEVWA